MKDWPTSWCLLNMSIYFIWLCFNYNCYFSSEIVYVHARNLCMSRQSTNKLLRTDSNFPFILFVLCNWKPCCYCTLISWFSEHKLWKQDNILIYLIILWFFWRINEHVHRNSDCLNTVITCTLSVHPDSCIFYGV